MENVRHPTTNSKSKMIPDLERDYRPMYIRVQEALTELLDRQVYQPDDQLPSEPELAQKLGVSRATLREALRSLEERGIIIRKHGVGTFVSSPVPLIESGLELLESIDSLARKKGFECLTQDLVIEQEQAGADIAAKLEIDEEDNVVVVRRTKVFDGEPMAYMHDVVPEKVATLEEVRKGFKGSVLDFLVQKGELLVAYAWANIRPVAVDDFLADKLAVRVGSPVLLLEEFLYSEANQVIEYSLNYFVPKFCQFHIIRRVKS
ncbi:GntR family transcriptional regulator [Candidatus Hakubella thermalkaliphila]|nr:GntR family transcriptional regulator [Candidatus Hakubella thermalkaliphila]